MSDNFDLLLTGGTVIDPTSGAEQQLHIGITAGRIAAVRSDISPVNARKVLNVKGCIVTPGLIDFHVHSYWGVNPYGFNADPICLASGVTTTIDAGSSGPTISSAFANWSMSDPALACSPLSQWRSMAY